MIQLPFGWTTNIWGLLILLLLVIFIISRVVQYWRDKIYRRQMLELGNLCNDMANIFASDDIDTKRVDENLTRIESLAKDVAPKKMEE